MYLEKCIGLVVCGSNEILKLSDVKIFCSVTHLISFVETTFTYCNHLKKPAESKFVFPLNDVAVFSFEATVNGRLIVAECRPRAEAQVVYDEAVAKGHAAFIMHLDEQTQDIFSMSIGQIPMDATVSIKLKYVGHLEAQNVSTDTFEGSEAVFTLPSVICPRYAPIDKTIETEFDSIAGITWTSFPYSITFKADLRMPEAIKSVTSDHDNFLLELDETNPKCAKVTLNSGFKPDHLLSMCIRMSDFLHSFALIETGNAKKTSVLSQNCLMAQFLPDFSSFSDEQDLKTELIFVVDRSGSMRGPRIQQASESLMLFLSSLPPGCRFQIIGFGSTYSALFPEPVDYNEDTFSQAQQYQSQLNADMGGTEILAPLRAAFDSPLTGQGWYKEVILLTDGEVWNTNEIVGLIASNVHKARLFAVGIGSDSPPAMISALARAGRGTCTFVRDETQLRSAVMKILASALQPRATVTQLDWNLTVTKPDGTHDAVSIVSAPTLPPPVFVGSYSTVYALFDGDPSLITGIVRLRLQILEQEKVLAVPIGSDTCVLSSSEDAPVHRLMGKCLLNELNDQYKALQMQNATNSGQPNVETELKKIRNRIEQISCLLNVISPYTSFVGVDPVKNELLVASGTAENTPQTERFIRCSKAVHPNSTRRVMLCGPAAPANSEPLCGTSSSTFGLFGSYVPGVVGPTSTAPLSSVQSDSDASVGHIRGLFGSSPGSGSLSNAAVPILTGVGFSMSSKAASPDQNFFSLQNSLEHPTTTGNFAWVVFCLLSFISTTIPHMFTSTDFRFGPAFTTTTGT